jgi:hypothetical protein
MGKYDAFWSDVLDQINSDEKIGNYYEIDDKELLSLTDRKYPWGWAKWSNSGEKECASSQVYISFLNNLSTKQSLLKKLISLRLTYKKGQKIQIEMERRKDFNLKYRVLEKGVFNHLISEHDKDKTFTFSVRRKGSKGAECDIFIGTENSNYFLFTLWEIPIEYPGASNDLIDYGVFIKDNHATVSLSCLHSIDTSYKREQSELNLEFLDFLEQELKPIADTNGWDFKEIDHEAKSRRFELNAFKELETQNQVVESLKTLISITQSVVDNAIKKFRSDNPKWNGRKISLDEFDKRIAKLNSRLLKNKCTEIKIGSEKATKDLQVRKMNSLNQILYGPPGTGKTYHTIDLAVQIAAPNEYLPTHSDNKAVYERLVKEKRIVFSTFHQSMSYEDFVEGIKPKTNDGQVTYEIEDGIFKLVCEKAHSNKASSEQRKIPFEDAFEKFVNDWEGDQEMKFPLRTEGYDFTIIGFNETSIKFRKSSGGTGHTLSIATLKRLYYGEVIDFKQGVGIYYPSVIKKIESYNEEAISTPTLDNYILIIDEINRGNVASIFGELITLIEDSKRKGNDEELLVTLPYSKEPFSVPSNLYIIGTMNTADRSVEALDTALRRRFVFTEMMPEPELLSPFRLVWELFWKYEEVKWEDEPYLSKETALFKLLGVDSGFNEGTKYILWDEIKDHGKDESQIALFQQKMPLTNNGVNLQKLLETINERIEVLKDRDHLIGHSYFMQVQDEKDLADAFNQKIIPLLKEYFYGDFGQIALVLGKGFIEQKAQKKIEFADFVHEAKEDFRATPIYEFKQIDKSSVVAACKTLMKIQDKTPE